MMRAGYHRLLIGFWVTEKQLHRIDTTTVTIVGLAILFLPKIGVMTWPQVRKQVPWGIIIDFGVAISLCTALLDTKAAKWLANILVQALHLDTLGSFGLVAGLALLPIHFGFACATSLTSALLPINALQNMVCLGTETFNSKQFTKIGLWPTDIGHALMLAFVLTLLKCLGYV